jgi:hypothetical protein
MSNICRFVRVFFFTVASLIAAGALLLPFALTGCNDTPSGPPASLNDTANLPGNDELLRELDEVLDFTFTDRHLNLRDHAAWQIVHGALAFQRSYKVDKDGELVSVVDYLLAGGRMKGWNFEPGVLDTNSGRRGLRAILEQGSKTGQGHSDQWLGYLSGCGLTPDQTIKVGDDTYTMADLVQQVEWDVPRNVLREYSWTLMGLTAYRRTDYEWTASDGQKWNIAKLVEIEAGHDLAESPCGGTHRLYGLTLAFNRHLEQGGKIEGPWKLTDDKIKEAIKNARMYQNPDGTFSTNYFQRTGRSPDLAQNLGTTGHILEFLTLAMTDEQLREPWVQRAALSLCDIFRRTKDVPLECGALYHAAHGLVLYRERMFGTRTFPSASESAITKTPSSASDTTSASTDSIQ